jgi:hypothetical protein
MNRLVGSAFVPQCCDCSGSNVAKIAMKRESRRRELRSTLGCLAGRNARK